MSCNTKTSLAAVIDAVNAQLNNNYVDRDDPRINQGVFTEPTIRGGLMLDEAAKLDFCGYVTECGQREPFGKQWVDRPLYPYTTLVSYEDGGEVKSRWQDIDDVVAGTEIGESYTTYEETRSLGLQGYTIIDSFELGATITQRNEALRYTADGKLYRWAGDLPKTVDIDSTPESSGGFGANAWLEVSDAALRQEILTGGLITDAIVIATAKGVNAAARTQRDINSESVSVNDFATPQDAVNHLKSKGGGELYFPFGDYPCRVLIDSPNIRMRGDKGTILRSADTSTIVDVAEGGLNFELDGFDIRGQNLETEGMSNENNTVNNTNSLHCIRIREKGARLRNFKTSAARYDGLYVDYRGEVDLQVENFYIGSTARNPLSWIAGQKARFKNGHFFLDNQYTSDQDIRRDGLYLVDFEPNSVADQYRDIVFEGVSFESAHPSSGARLLILQDTNLGDANSLDVYLKDCKFLRNNGLDTCIRLKADTEVKTFTGLNLDNVTFPGRAALILSGDGITLRNSTWRNVRIGISSLTYYIYFGEGCSLENIKTTSSTAGSVGIEAGKVRLSNVFDLPDFTPTGASYSGDVSIEGDLTYTGDFIGSNHAIFSKAIDVDDTTEYVSILKVGIRGTFKVTIAGADASSGANSLHISESWVVVSNDYTSPVQPNFILNSETTGLDVMWAASGGSGARTLKVKARDPSSNQFIVTVEVFGGNTGNNNTPVTWLI